MTGAASISRLLRFLRAARSTGHCCFTPGDFCYRWATETGPVASPGLRIWQDERGRDAGFAWLSGDHLHIVTRAETARLRPKMLAWGEARLQAAGRCESLRIPINERSPEWEALLAGRGYQPGEPVLVLRSHALAALAAPALPAGYRIGHVEDAAQLEGWAASYRAAFAPEEMTSALRRPVSRSSLYDPELDLIACDARGAVVAFALAWFDRESRTGTFEPIGCRPDHQRRGLARALMLAGLQRLERLGARRAYVTTTRRRVAAGRLYKSIGFLEEARSRTWSKVQSTSS